MGKITLKNGDLLESKEKYIAHQCNCLTTRASNLAQSVFSKFPYADIYASRKIADTPGSIIVRGNGQDQRFVINMLGQLYPGRSKYPDSSKDGFTARQRYFKSCLDKIALIPDLTSIAFPFQIGCGIAGGNWMQYRHMIKVFADQVEASVVVYKI
jgi:O-acetyl-ADP-ribose deacetylase (regulator of RNase III)